MEDCTRDNYLQYLYYVLLLCPTDDSDSIEFFLFIYFFNSRLENVYRKMILLSSSRIFVGKKKIKKERERKKTLHCRVNTTVQKICTCKLQ